MKEEKIQGFRRREDGELCLSADDRSVIKGIFDFLLKDASTKADVYFIEHILIGMVEERTLTRIIEVHEKEIRGFEDVKS